MQQSVAVGCKCVYLEHGTGVNTREHNDSSSLKCSDPQAKLHFSTLATLCHSVLDVTVSRETQRCLACTFTNHRCTVLKLEGEMLEFIEKKRQNT